ncbi:glycosyl transferase family protein [Luteithermobacter gelatinilyticus]|uniref:glycosyl transferase family protein n=1 Tax=Luteithermobacter gelatinilyticus TaxID=2582913 RepID=UPI001105E856|nr:glycosyl transferase family protein [Luteithermobacter gelatinilyticus]
MTKTPEDFAPYIRILGRGPTNARHLTREEAREAFAGALSGKMADVQIGALLLLLRYRGEDAAELAGIVEAMRDSLAGNPAMPSPEEGYRDLIDWPSYAAGKSRELPWFLLSAKLLAENGHKVFMHGYNSHLEKGLATENCLPAIGETACRSLEDAREKLEVDNFAFLPLKTYSPRILEFLKLRRFLGVRSIINTAVRLINPFRADTLFLGIFHPPYIRLNLEAARLLGQPRLGVVKGGAGEAERNPFKKIILYALLMGEEEQTGWPAGLNPREVEKMPVTLDHLGRVWRGEVRDEKGLATLLGTAAQALYLKGCAETPEQAEKMARVYWQAHLSQRQ